ncbi:hypothetical protein RHMOL_Rhmol02G0304000 [Rhododendron molle]|uniref:Uncharacterized protein n=1 Tax=Rhododendron molle TaxID=49168 RepID=A0ACC0PZ21_RHOML|nr:hypothetical protein RHMOL_Rhmol02G0304000 [Rhododendron molle]
MQLHSSDQPSMDPSDNGSSSKEGERKSQQSGVRIEVSLEEILKCSKMRHNDAARQLKVSESTLRRVCRDYGIHRWPPRNTEKLHPFLPPSFGVDKGQSPQLNSDLHSEEDSCSVGDISSGFQDWDPNENSSRNANINLGFPYADMVTIKAKYKDFTLKFELSLWSGLVELHQEVAKRLDFGVGTYNVEYKHADESILIACDKDLQDYIRTSRSQGNTAPIVVQLERK